MSDLFDGDDQPQHNSTGDTSVQLAPIEDQQGLTDHLGPVYSALIGLVVGSATVWVMYPLPGLLTLVGGLDPILGGSHELY